MKQNKLVRFGIMSKKESKFKESKFEELAYLISIVYNLIIRHLDILLHRHGLSLPKFNILAILKYKGGEAGISQTDITHSLIVCEGNITGILDRMQKDEILIRTPHPKDRRINLVRITLKGSKLLEEIWPQYEEILKNIIGKIPAKQQGILINIFNKWANSLV
jgi:MarR family 2-MHQ and catechol resistance regulon transcriptional repressor